MMSLDGFRSQPLYSRHDVAKMDEHGYFDDVFIFSSY